MKGNRFAELALRMSEPLIYIDRSEVRDGALDDLKAAVEGLVAFVKQKEPRILSYSVYISDDGRQMTVTHVHPDSESFDHHMEVGGPAFRPFADLLTQRSIRVYGKPSEEAIRRLHEKAQMLGCSDVVIESAEAGFSRLSSPRPGDQGSGSASSS
jgi:quinol monooxygenase YgiN